MKKKYRIFFLSQKKKDFFPLSYRGLAIPFSFILVYIDITEHPKKSWLDYNLCFPKIVENEMQE